MGDQSDNNFWRKMAGCFSFLSGKGKRTPSSVPLAGERAKEALQPMHIQNPALTPRRLPLRKGKNFRDLGGLRSTDGREIIPGQLFRADDLHSLCPEDLDCLAAIPIVTVIDFRSESERLRLPDKLPASVRHYLHFPIVPGRLEPWNPEQGLREKGGHRFMMDIYRSLVTDLDNRLVYQEFFRRIQNPEHTPLLFHCSAGKDRTGMAAAFILFALGVDEESILEDYLHSNICLAGKYDRQIAEKPERAPIFFAEPDYLHTAVAAMKEKNGSVEQYLVNALGVDIDAMRARFLR